MKNVTYNIIGHRGNKNEYVENSLAGFKSLLHEDDIYAIELDIVISRDNKLVVSHDPFFLDKNDKKVFIYDENLKDIRQRQKLNDEPKGQASILPELYEVLALFKNSEKLILIEVKSFPSLPRVHMQSSELLQEIHALLVKFDMIANGYIISFDCRVIEQSFKQNPEVKVGLILGRNIIPISGIFNKLKPQILVMQKDWITAEQVIEIRQHGADVFAWTANQEADWERLLSIGVKNMITDKPLVLKTLNLKKK